MCCSVAKSCPTLCEPHELQYPRLPSPSLSPRVCSNSSPMSQWCYITISSSAPSSPLPSIFSSIRVFSSESGLHIGCQNIGASHHSAFNDRQLTVVITTAICFIEHFQCPILHSCLTCVIVFNPYSCIWQALLSLSYKNGNWDLGWVALSSMCVCG